MNAVKSISRGLVISVLMGLLAVTSSIASPTLSISPPVATPAMGSAFDVSVDISGVSDLFAFPFDLSFDPSVVAATGIDEGLFLQSGGASFFLPGTIDNTLGVISFTANALIGAVSGVSGDGPLAIVHLLAVGSGTSVIDLSGAILLDSTLGDIAFSVSSARVDVAGTAPEPSSLLLVAAAGLALVNVRGGRVKPN